jgi:hypothetical protein
MSFKGVLHELSTVIFSIGIAWAVKYIFSVLFKELNRKIEIIVLKTIA